MSKQAEREFALKVDQRLLYDKPYYEPRVFREFTLVLDLFQERFRQGSILDMGCGPGWTSLMLARAGYEVLGVDISERMIEVAQERSLRENTPAEFAVGDMEELNLGDRIFDGALFFDCLHHCPQYTQALMEAYTYLRPGGWVLLCETTLLHRFSRTAHYATDHFGVTELGFSRRQLRRALHQSGFTRITFYHDPGPCYRGLPGLCKTAARLLCDFLFYFPQAKNIAMAQKHPADRCQP
jgi:SAM-dependent methyltransferase